MQLHLWILFLAFFMSKNQHGKTKTTLMEPPILIIKYAFGGLQIFDNVLSQNATL